MLAEATGLEPAASCVTGRRSNQLNYAPYSVPRFPRIPKSFRDRAEVCWEFQMAVKNPLLGNYVPLIELARVPR